MLVLLLLISIMVKACEDCGEMPMMMEQQPDIWQQRGRRETIGGTFGNESPIGGFRNMLRGAFTRKGIQSDNQHGMNDQIGRRDQTGMSDQLGQMGSDRFMDDEDYGRYKKYRGGYLKSKSYPGMPSEQQDYFDGGSTFGRSEGFGRKPFSSEKYLSSSSTAAAPAMSWGEEYDQPRPYGSSRSSLKSGLRSIGSELKQVGRDVKQSIKDKAATALDAVLDFTTLTNVGQFRSFGLHHHECHELTPEQVSNAPTSFFRVMSRQCFQDLTPDTLSAVPGMYFGRIRWWRDATAEQVSAIPPDAILHVPFKRLGRKPLVVASNTSTMGEVQVEDDVVHPCLGITEEHEEMLMRDRKVWREYFKRCRCHKPSWTRWIPIVLFVLLILFLLFVLFYSFASTK